MGLPTEHDREECLRCGDDGLEVVQHRVEHAIGQLDECEEHDEEEDEVLGEVRAGVAQGGCQQAHPLVESQQLEELDGGEGDDDAQEIRVDLKTKVYIDEEMVAISPDTHVNDFLLVSVVKRFHQTRMLMISY